MTTNPYRDFAQRLAISLNFHITPPIPVGEKFPCKKWKPYQIVPPHKYEIENWSENYSKYNYGIITGRNAGYVFVDCDSKSACKIVAKLCAPTPLVQRSGSGRGVQFGYRYPANNPDLYIKTQAKIKLDGIPQNIDIRGVGGLVVGPGCKHRLGGTYTMLTDWFALTPDDVPFFDPAWLQLDTTAPKARIAPYQFRDAGDLSALQQMAREHLLPVRGAQAGKGAEKYALAVAFVLVHGFGLSVKEALPVFLEWGTKRTNVDEYGGYYPWDESDLERKLEYADCHDDKEGRERGYLLPVDENEILKHL